MSESVSLKQSKEQINSKTNTAIWNGIVAPRIQNPGFPHPTRTDFSSLTPVIEMPPVRLFADTPFFKDIVGAENIEEGKKMAQEITKDSLTKSSLSEYIRDVILLSRFGTDQQIGELLDTVLERMTPAGNFINTLYFPNDSPDPEIQRLIHVGYTDSTDAFAGGLLKCLISAYNDKSTKISSENVKALYTTGRSANVYLDLSQFLRFALEYDKRNEASGRSLHAKEFYIQEASINVLGRLPEIPVPGHNYADDLELQLHHIMVYEPEILENILTTSLVKAKSDEEIRNAVTRIGNFLGFNIVRKLIREHAHSTPSFKPVFEKTFRLMGLDFQDEIASSLEEIYDKADFSSYPPYKELLPFETGLLEANLKSSDTILDAGCGQGRLLTALRKKGRNVSGFDIVKADVDYAKAKNPDADIREGSWNKIPYDGNTFNILLCLGRGATHNLSIEEWRGFLQEGKRILRDNGSIILDLPDPTSGEYKEYIDTAKNAAISLGIFLMKPGEINDSPDNKQFFDRFIIYPEQLKSIARLYGFKAEVLASKEYTAVKDTNLKNKNIYYKLTKTSPQEDITTEEKEKILLDIYTGVFNENEIVQIAENLKKRGMLTQLKQLQLSFFFKRNGNSA